MRIQLPERLNQQNPETKLIRGLIEASLQAADPGRAVMKAIGLHDEVLEVGGQTYELGRYQRIFLISIGKAGLAMADAIGEILGDRLTGGVVISKGLAGRMRFHHLERLQLFRGNHPVPGKQSLLATRKIIELFRERRKTDLYICAISGGGSSLLSSPVEGITLADYQEATRLLLECGADIQEMNVIRKHLDRVKGGGLCRLSYPATMIALVLSDVIGNPLDVIASGPTVSDSSTFSDGLNVFRKYKLLERLPRSVVEIFESGAMGLLDETLRSQDPCFNNTQTVLVGSNLQACNAAREFAKGAGWNTLLLTTFQQGEARQSGVNLAGILRQIHLTGDPISVPACVIIGGETTVTVQSRDGLGGRNLEVALGGVEMLGGVSNVALVTLATDGEDGPTDAAGAVIMGDTLGRGRSKGLEPRIYLASNDSYAYFSQLGDLIKTGRTGTNVNDLVFLIAW